MAVWRGIWDTSDIWLEEGICSGNLALANAIAILWGLLICSIIDLQHGRLTEQIGPGKGTANALARLVLMIICSIIVNHNHYQVSLHVGLGQR